MTTRSWLNIVLLLAVLLLAALVYFEPGKKPQQQVQLLAISPASLQQLEIRRPEAESVQLQQRDGRWYLQSPVEIAADTFMVEQILSFVAQPSLQRYPATGLDLTKYGLQPARVKLLVDGVELGLIIVFMSLFVGIMSGFPVAFAIGGAATAAFGILAVLDNSGILLHAAKPESR